MKSAYRFSVSTFVALAALSSVNTTAFAGLSINPYPKQATQVQESEVTGKSAEESVVDKPEAMDVSGLSDMDTALEPPMAKPDQDVSNPSPTPSAPKFINFVVPTKEQIETGGVIYHPVSISDLVGETQEETKKESVTQETNKSFSDTDREALKAELKQELELHAPKPVEKEEIKAELREELQREIPAPLEKDKLKEEIKQELQLEMPKPAGKEEIKAELKEELQHEWQRPISEAHMQAQAADMKNPEAEPLVVSTQSEFTGESTIEAVANATMKVFTPFGRMIRDLTSIETASGEESTPSEISTNSTTSVIEMDDAATQLQNLEPSVGHPMDITQRPSLADRGLVAIQVGQNKAVPPPAVQQETPAVVETISIPAMPAIADWSFVQGQSLRDVLGAWSQQADVDMIWSIPQGYAVPTSASISGTYEQAVQTLLEQYSLYGDRPLGSLHINPQSGQRTLVIQAQG